MANTKTKIEKLRLQDRVHHLFFQDKVTTAKGIAEKLREDGVKISDASVARYLNSVKDDWRDASRQVVYDHVNAELPKDLEALEEMESRCLDWSREDGSDLVARMADASVELSGEVDRWARMFATYGAAMDQKKKARLVKGIIKRCLEAVNREAQFLDRRLKSIKQATQIIEIKLRHATGLDKDSSGNIVIVDSKEEYYRQKAMAEAKDGGRVSFSAVMGGKK